MTHSTLPSHTNVLFLRSSQVVLGRFTWFGGTEDSPHQAASDNSLQAGGCLHLRFARLPFPPAGWRRRRRVHFNTTKQRSFGRLQNKQNRIFVLKGTLNIFLVQEGLTGGGVLLWVRVQERRVGREGANGKSLLRCELPAQGPTNHVVNRKVKHLHTHTHTSVISVWRVNHLNWVHVN